MYRDPSAAAGRIRYEHLNSVVRLTPITMIANVGSASLVLWAFQDEWSQGLLLWWAALVLIAGAALVNWSRFRRRPPKAVSCKGIRRATWNSGTLAAVWAIMPILWFAPASSGQQLVIATVVTGMLGAGTFVLGALPFASLLYGSLFTVSALWALLSTGDPLVAKVVVLICFYSPMVLVGGYSAWRKATAFLQSQNDAIRNEQMLAVVLQDFEQNAADALWETDGKGRVHHPSERLASLLRTSTRSLAQTPLVEWLQLNARQGAAEIRGAFERRLPFAGIAVTLAQAGELHHLAFNGKPLFDELGEFGRWRGVLSDRSTEVRAQAQLSRLAHTDSLTGLINRFALYTAMDQQVQAQRKSGALLLIDLDHFKFVNDTFGHSAGDALLVQVSRCLEEQVPASCVVARLGGDEFAILLTEPDPGLATSKPLASRLLYLIGQHQPNAKGNYRVGASIGIASLDSDVVTVDELMIRADIALYAAKAQGRDRFVIYNPQLRAQAQRRTQIEDGLRQAIQSNELNLHWQPKIDLRSWKITGVEALMRWNSAALGPVSPGEFIPIAEQAGIIRALGLWALQQACAYALQFPDDVEVAVNVSSTQLTDPQFLQALKDVLATTGLPAQRLEIEITESVLMDDTDAVLNRLHALRDLGVNIALDDFGTGYSSLSYLCRFPFSTLKIDRSFVQEALDRPEALAVVHTIVQLALSLGMKTVCEGIETRAQLNMVHGASIHAAQGYLLSPPLSRASFTELLSKWNAHAAPQNSLSTGFAPML